MVGRQDHSRKAGLLVGWSVTQGEEGAWHRVTSQAVEEPGRAGEGCRSWESYRGPSPSFPVCPSPDDLRHEVWSP